MGNRVVYQEIRKIFFDRKVIIFIVLFGILQASAVVNGFHKWRDKVKDVKQYNKIADSRNGEIDWGIIDRNIVKSLDSGTDEAMELLDGDINSIWNFEYHCAASRSIDWQKEKDGLDLGKTSEFHFCQMLNQVGKPEYVNCSGINLFAQNITGTISAVFISLLTILIISPVYVKEEKCNMDKIIRSSLIGTRKDHKCKMISVYTYVSVFVIMYYMFFLLIYLAAFGNWNVLHMPVNAVAALYMSPYKLNILQYVISGLLRLWLGAMTTANIACIASEIGRGSIGNMLISFAILFFPLVLPKFGLVAKIGGLFPIFTMQGYFSLSQYIDYSIGGRIITYRWMSAAVMVLLNIFCFGLLFWRKK